MMPRNIDIAPDPIPKEANEVSWSSAFEPQEENDEDLHEPSWPGMIAVGIIFIVFGFGMFAVSFGLGMGVVFMGVLFIVGAIVGSAKEFDAGYGQTEVDQWEQMETEREWEEAARARQRARQHEVDEIIKAVKTTIRVRCRYCGTLNDESANKCESCGGSL